jgi:hypothetical protein
MDLESLPKCDICDIKYIKKTNTNIYVRNCTCYEDSTIDPFCMNCKDFMIFNEKYYILYAD